MGLLEIEEAIKKLPHDELDHLREWFEQYDAHEENPERMQRWYDESDRRFDAYKRGELGGVTLAEIRAKYEP